MNSFKMNMATSLRLKMLAPALVLASFSAPVMANNQYNDTARVLSAIPQTERVNMPRQECRTEYQQQSVSNADHSITGAVIGGIAGGLLGNTIGRGNGRVAAAAVGAGVGAIAGDRIGNTNNGNVRSVPVQSCYQVDNWQTINVGYLVSYEYNGRTYTTMTDNLPGSYIQINVNVAPISRGMAHSTYIQPIRYGNERYGHDLSRNERRGEQRGWGNHRNEGRYY